MGGSTPVEDTVAGRAALREIAAAEETKRLREEDFERFVDIVFLLVQLHFTKIYLTNPTSPHSAFHRRR